MSLSSICTWERFILSISALAELNAQILPNGLGGFWDTSGTGDFLAADGTTFEDTYDGAVFYQPGAADIANGSVVLTLQNNNPGGCPDKSDSVTVEILK
ncbi:MAG: hypothetical protein IPJ40_08050 [Saprospirales bacterium]|nr:hypothetical protein [Saprospirales bacterium]